MKNYYQQEKGGFKLPKEIYHHTRSFIGCYRFFQNTMDLNLNKSLVKITENDLVHIVQAEKHIKLIDEALINYVPKEYRKAVFEHTVDKIEYLELEEKYYLTTPSMKRYVQRFTYGVAKLLGEDYTYDERPTYKWKG